MKTFKFSKKEQQLLKDIYYEGIGQICRSGCYIEKYQNNPRIQCYANCKFHKEIWDLWEKLENECE
jgi:hypothetical protein